MIDREKPEQYPPNVQAILKRPAPAAAWLGQELLSVDVEKGEAEIAYTLGEAHFNKYKAIHGGVTAAIMDDVMSVAAGLVAQWGEITPTLEMKVSYLATARAGRLVARANVIRRGKTVMFLEATLSDETGKALATGSCTVMIAELKK